MKRSTLAILLAVTALSLLAAGGAGATTAAQRVYTIIARADRQILAVSSAQVKSAITTTQHKLTPCLGALAQAAETASQPAQALAAEFGEQYQLTASRRLYVPVVTELGQLGAVQALGGKLRSELRGEATTLRRLEKLNICADVRSWQSHGFSAGSEPADTKFAVRSESTLKHPPKLTSLAGSVRSQLSASQLHTLQRQTTRALNHLNALQKQVETSLQRWLDSAGG